MRPTALPCVHLSSIIFADTETDVTMDGGAAIFFVSYAVSAGWILIQADMEYSFREKQRKFQTSHST